MDIKVFRNKAFRYCWLSFSITFFMVLSISYLIPNFSQLAMGQSALIAGIIMLPGSILTMVLSPFAGKMYDAFGAKMPLTIGIVVVIISQLIFFLVVQHASIPALIATYMIFSFGQCLIISNTMTHGLDALPKEEKPDGNAVYNTAQQLFGAIGTSIISSIVASAQAHNDMTAGTIAGTTHAFLLLTVLAILSLISIICALRCKTQAS